LTRGTDNLREPMGQTREECVWIDIFLRHRMSTTRLFDPSGLRDGVCQMHNIPNEISVSGTGHSGSGISPHWLEALGIIANDFEVSVRNRFRNLKRPPYVRFATTFC
jgi:hypothetical protein